MNRSEKVKKTVPLMEKRILCFPMHYHFCAKQLLNLQTCFLFFFIAGLESES